MSLNSAKLLPLIREAYSQHPEWRVYSPERLASALHVWGYWWERPKVSEVVAALEALDIERGVA